MSVILDKDTKLSLAVRNSGWITFDVKGDNLNDLMNELYSTYLNSNKKSSGF